MFPLRSKWFAWWYLTIAVGFVLLAITQGIIRGTVWGIVLRVVIAAGFAALAAFEFKTRDKR
jgi:hypothetical protein